MKTETTTKQNEITWKQKSIIILNIIGLCLVNFIFSLFLILLFIILFIPMLLSNKLFKSYAYYFLSRLNLLRTKEKPSVNQ